MICIHSANFELIYIEKPWPTLDSHHSYRYCQIQTDMRCTPTAHSIHYVSSKLVELDADRWRFAVDVVLPFYDITKLPIEQNLFLPKNPIDSQRVIGGNERERGGGGEADTEKERNANLNFVFICLAKLDIHTWD